MLQLLPTCEHILINENRTIQQNPSFVKHFPRYTQDIHHLKDSHIFHRKKNYIYILHLQHNKSQSHSIHEIALAAAAVVAIVVVVDVDVVKL